MEFSAYKLRKCSLLVRRRDKKICQCCHNEFPIQKLQNHHIYPKDEYPQFAYELDKMITLCIHCHLNVVHSSADNPKRFRSIFCPYLRRKAIKEFNKKYQGRI